MSDSRTNNSFEPALFNDSVEPIRKWIINMKVPDFSPEYILEVYFVYSKSKSRVKIERRITGALNAAFGII